MTDNNPIRDNVLIGIQKEKLINILECNLCTLEDKLMTKELGRSSYGIDPV